MDVKYNPSTEQKAINKLINDPLTTDNPTKQRHNSTH